MIDPELAALIDEAWRIYRRAEVNPVVVHPSTNTPRTASAIGRSAPSPAL